LPKQKKLLFYIINTLIVSLSMVVAVMNIYALINSSTTIPVSLISNILFPIIFGLFAVKSLISKDRHQYFYLVIFLLILIISLISIKKILY